MPCWDRAGKGELAARELRARAAMREPEMEACPACNKRVRATIAWNGQIVGQAKPRGRACAR
eukprot:6572538-Alexandrium_andersonii.AAC.1